VPQLEVTKLEPEGPEDEVAELEPEPAPEVPAVTFNEDAQVSLLGYHEFTDSAGKVTQMRIHADKFRAQMEAIDEAGIEVISLADFIAWKKGERSIPDPSILITIDDGWKSTYTVAYPILKEFGFPFSIFLYKTYVDGGGRALKTSQIKEMLESGLVELGSHSWSHPLSGRTFRNEGSNPLGEEDYDAYLERELRDSKSFLEERFGVEVTTFAFPGGIFNDAILEKGKGVGYEMMVTVAPRRATWGMPIHQVGRFIVHGNDDRNFRSATRFSGGSTDEKKLLVVGGDGGEEEHPPVTVSPEPGAEIPERFPLIKADLSGLAGVDPETVTMTLSGFGRVPATFDTGGGMLEYRPARKLRSKRYSVSVRFQREGEEKPDVVAWSFRVDRKASYLAFGSEPGDEEGVATEPGS
jgi:peptidoglycan/xylan/chitin deacetylase (PgdA/CDA1 family)